MVFTLMLFNCSTVKVVNNWQEDNMPSVTNKDVLVVTKADDHLVSVRFETDIVQNLLANEVMGVESFKLLPNMNLTEELNTKELKAKSKQMGLIW